VRLLDLLLFSSLWVAAAAAALAAATGEALGGGAGAGPLLLAFGGTLAVYDLDRLRDLARDRASAPARSAFVDRHRIVLVGLALGGAALGAAGAALAGPRALLPLVPALPLALAHRRLKRLWMAKAAYVTAAWVLVVVGVPALAAGARTPDAAWAAALVGLAVFANAVASNVRDAEAAAARFGSERPLRLARACAAAGAAAALLAPAALRPLGLVCAATFAALLGFRPSERYGLGVVDGALLLGALAALAAKPLSPAAPAAGGRGGPRECGRTSRARPPRGGRPR
jgi:4-hydroxybenzoate polyprenyltransferase